MSVLCREPEKRGVKVVVEDIQEDSVFTAPTALPDPSWRDRDDLVETDRAPSDDKPRIELHQIGVCPRFTFKCVSSSARVILARGAKALLLSRAPQEAATVGAAAAQKQGRHVPGRGVRRPRGDVQVWARADAPVPPQPVQGCGLCPPLPPRPVRFGADWSSTSAAVLRRPPPAADRPRAPPTRRGRGDARPPAKRQGRQARRRGRRDPCRREWFDSFPRLPVVPACREC